MSLCQFFLGFLIAAVDSVAVVAQFVQRCHPCRDLLDAKNIMNLKIFLCDFRLTSQRFDLKFQLFNLIVDTDQILLGLLQFSLRIFLTVTEAGDSGCFFHHFTPVCRFIGDDLTDPALTDDRIAITAKTGIHQQRVDILQTYLFLIDVVFAVTASVVASGDGNFGGVQIKKMIGIIQQKSNLGIAQWRTFLRASKNDVFHFGSAQSLRTLLSHYP